METVWFVLVAFMLIAYVVLDGFDLGAGIMHLAVARTDDERRMVLRAIGPVWDGNEVWLLAGGGTLFFAFPLLYASSFSGFYLPLNMVLWLLILRGIGIEFRMHIDNELWRDFFDGLFALGSVLLSIFFGAALGNVIRGVPLRPDHYFFEPLWTNFKVGANSGILDWYTVLIGVLALVTLMLHGAHYIALKTTEPINVRARRVAMRAWFALVLLTVASLTATLRIRPQVTDNFRVRPWGAIVPLVVIASLIAIPILLRRGRDFAAFLASTAYIVAMMGGAAFAMYPFLLPATTNPAYSLTIYNAKTGPYSLSVGLIWWGIGIALAIAYFIFLYRSFRDKVSLEGEGY